MVEKRFLVVVVVVGVCPGMSTWAVWLLHAKPACTASKNFFS